MGFSERKPSRSLIGKRFQGVRARRRGVSQKRSTTSQIELHHAFVHFICARGIGGDIGGSVARLNNPFVDQIFLDFFAANIGQHLTVNFDAGRKRLTTLRFHLPAKSRILDDVLFRVGEIVFGQNGANTPPLQPQ